MFLHAQNLRYLSSRSDAVKEPANAYVRKACSIAAVTFERGRKFIKIAQCAVLEREEFMAVFEM